MKNKAKQNEGTAQDRKDFALYQANKQQEANDNTVVNLQLIRDQNNHDRLSTGVFVGGLLFCVLFLLAFYVNEIYKAV